MSLLLTSTSRAAWGGVCLGQSTAQGGARLRWPALDVPSAALTLPTDTALLDKGAAVSDNLPLIQTIWNQQHKKSECWSNTFATYKTVNHILRKLNHPCQGSKLTSQTLYIWNQLIHYMLPIQRNEHSSHLWKMGLWRSYTSVKNISLF